MRPPRWTAIVLRALARRRDGPYLGDVDEIYLETAERLGPGGAAAWYRREALRFLPRYVAESVRWRTIMLRNSVKTALRMFRRDFAFASLNVAGLALGLAGFALIAMWVRDEVGWDRFHPRASRIIRLESNMVSQPAPLGPFLAANYPEIAATVRTWSAGSLVVSAGDRVFDEDGFVLADSGIFDVFTVPFVAGARETAFPGPDTVVLTERAARKYFGAADPVGRTLTVENRWPVRVTGVVRNPPGNSDLRFEVLGDFRLVGNFRKGYELDWGNHEYPTYALLAEGVAAEAVAPKISRVVMDRLPIMPAPLTLKPLSRIHLYEDGAIRPVIIFSTVAAFILLVAGCNFVSLTTARSGRRAREIAVRKVAGADRSQLVQQFLIEAVVSALAALPVSLAAAAAALPVFRALSGKDFGTADLFASGMIPILLAVSAAVGLLAGAYPALLLSSLRPAGLLKPGGAGAVAAPRGSGFRRILVVVQFSVSIVLLVVTLSIGRQVAFVRDYDLGIRKENVVYLPAKAPLLQDRQAFLDELTRQTGVLGATFASSLPSQVDNVASGIAWDGMDPDRRPAWAFISTDDRYLDTLGIALVAGRNFPGPEPCVKAPYFLLNERAAAEMGREDPVGTGMSLWGVKGTVLGVLKDFHFRSLHEPVQPLLMFIEPRTYNHILVKIRTGGGRTSESLDGARAVWEKFAPGIPFRFDFLDAAFARSYQAEVRMGRQFRGFSLLGIVISCLGLVGLTASMTELRRKEIGIRKVLGATTAGIVARINGEFAAPILLANLIAWPVGFLAVQAWLRSFACRVRPAAATFLVAAALVLAVAALTVSLLSARAARAKPAETLKCE